MGVKGIRGTAGDLACGFLYLLLGFWAVRAGLGPDRVTGWGVDLSGTLWFYDWVAHCVVTGTDPFWTPWFFHPAGMDVFAATGGNLLDALLAAPARLLLGWGRYYDPVLAMVLAGNGLAAHLALRGAGYGRGASLGGALLFQFHPVFMFELAEGRPTQAWAWTLPPTLLFLWRAAERPGPRPVVASGVLLGIMGWIYWFQVHLFLFCLLPAVVVRAWQRDRWRGTMRIAAALGLAAGMAAPAVVAALSRSLRGEIPGLGQQSGPGVAVMPSWDLLDPLGGIPDLSARFLVIWGLAVGVGMRFARRRLAWASCLALGLALAAGPRLRGPFEAMGNPVWEVAEAVLPWFSRFWYPYRAWTVLALAGAWIAAEGWSRLSRDLSGKGRRARWVGVVVLPLVVVGGTALPTLWRQALPSSPLPSSPLSMPAYVRAVRQDPGPVLALPFLCCGERVHLQPLHGAPLLGGMAEESEALRPPGLEERVLGSRAGRAVARASWGMRSSPEDGPLSREGIEGLEGVRWIVLHHAVIQARAPRPECWRGPPLEPDERVSRVERALERVLGPPDTRDRHATAWKLDSSR